MKTIQEMIEVMQAFEEGKPIQFWSRVSKDWEDATVPIWSWGSCDYRIKPEPKEPTYRPYESLDELKKDYIERAGIACSPLQNPHIWVKYKSIDGEFQVTGFGKNAVKVSSMWRSLDEMYDEFTYLDGSPVGKLVEE